MNKKIAAMLLVLWMGILIGLIIFAYNNPQKFIQTTTNPDLTPDQMFGGFGQFMKDMTSNLTPPPGLR